MVVFSVRTWTSVIVISVFRIHLLYMFYIYVTAFFIVNAFRAG